MNPENRNLILAITLSMAVLFGWQVFFVGPELEREAARQQVIAEQIAAADAESRSTLADSAGGTAAMPAAGGDDATTAVAAPRINCSTRAKSATTRLAPSSGRTSRTYTTMRTAPPTTSSARIRSVPPTVYQASLTCTPPATCTPGSTRVSRTTARAKQCSAPRSRAARIGGECVGGVPGSKAAAAVV